MPAELTELVLAHTRGQALRPIAQMRLPGLPSSARPGSLSPRSSPTRSAPRRWASRRP
jgi:hypothetical protein